MSDPLRDRLLEAARRVRAALEGPSVTQPSFPRMYCQGASRLLAKYLVEEGIGPVEGVANGERLVPRGGEEPVSQTHFWLECGGLIIDITADQFADFAGGPVVVTEDRSWHRQLAWRANDIAPQAWPPSRDRTFFGPRRSRGR